MNTSRTILGLVYAASLLACDSQSAPKGTTDAPPVETSPLTLSLRAAPASEVAAGTVAVDVNYVHKASRTAPRMMELYVRYADGLTYESAVPLAAVTAAGKQLVVQDQGGGLLRVVVYASGNTATLASGALARLTFGISGTPSGTVSLESRMPIFAPAEANDGVLLGPPLTLTPGKGAP